MSLKKLMFAFLTFAMAAQAWASLGTANVDIQQPSSESSAAEAARQAKVAEAFRTGDLMVLLDEGTPEEIGAAMAGKIAEGSAEAIPNGTEGNYAHRFVVNLNNNLRGQRMYWFDHGTLRKSFAISGARSGYRTPRGLFAVHNAMKMAYSKKYDNSPMPCALFFFAGGNYAIHGTEHISGLGAPASHGCVRTNPAELCPVWEELKTREELNSITVEIVDDVSQVAGIDQIAAYDSEHPIVVQANATKITSTKITQKKAKASKLSEDQRRYLLNSSGGLF